MWDITTCALEAAVAATPGHGEAEVHRVDHVGRFRPLRDHVDGAAEPLDGLDEGAPLGQRQVAVGLVVGIHEGVDDVLDPEMARLDHHVVAAPGQRHVPLLEASDCDKIVRQSDKH